MKKLLDVIIAMVTDVNAVISTDDQSAFEYRRLVIAVSAPLSSL